MAAIEGQAGTVAGRRSDGPAIAESRWAVAYDGIRLHYLSWTSAAQPARAVLLLVHGIAGHAVWFGDTAQHLAAAGVAVYAPDRRGSGRSEGPRGHLARYEDALADLRAFAALASDERPDAPLFVAASSWAAKLAVIYAAQPSVAAAGLVLLGPVFASRANPPLPARLAVVAGARLVPQWSLSSPLRPEMATPNPARQAFVRADSLQLRRFTLRFLWETVRMDRQRDRVTPRIRLPLLVLQGELDPIADVEVTRRWFAKVPGQDKTIVVYPGGGHLLDFDADATQYRADLTEWVLSRAAGSASSGGQNAS